jgi:hypothetical protein
MRATVFFLHYNKPASLKAKRPQLSVHWKKTCFVGDHVVCHAPTESRIRTRQPRVVMAGRATRVTQRAGVITVVA